MNDKLTKFLIVIFLTLLIWTWAYLSQEKEILRPGSIEVSPSAPQDLLVTFKLNTSEWPVVKVPLNPLTLKGSPSKISAFLDRYNLPPNNPSKEKLDFYYDPSEHGKSKGSHALNLLSLLEKEDKIHDLALTLVACDPEQIQVNIEQLELKKLPVECLNENGFPVQGAVVSPSFVDIYVREGYTGPATVILSPQDRDVARRTAVSVTPFVKLGVANVVREAAQPVQVSLQSEERLKPQAFQPSSVGFVMSQNLADQYTVELDNLAQLTSTTQFSATDEAMDAYKKMKYHLLIEVRDGDEQVTEMVLRPVIYNFPRSYFKNGEIVELTPPKLAVFKLVPISQAE